MSSNDMTPWNDAADAIIGGDQALIFATVTPASGVILTPLTNFGIRDRGAGTVEAVNTSVGIWRKLERLQHNPQVALAYHSRAHSFTDRTEYVLVQGTASFTPMEDRGYVDAI